MVELGIQVKLSARKITPYEALKKISKVRTGLKVAAAFFTVLGIFHTINSLYQDPLIAPDPAEWHAVAFVTILPCELILISIFLASAYFYLSVNMKQHFAKELEDEGKKIKAIFVLFSLSYISRAVVSLLKLKVIDEHIYAVYYSMYFFWDVLPLSSIMIYHLKAFRAEERQRNKPSVDWTHQLLTTSSVAETVSEVETHGVPKLETTPSVASLFHDNDDMLNC